jgi:hypothetical protein
MQLEHVLCEVDADDANFFHGCPLFQLVLRHHKLGTLRCRQSGIHPISEPPKRLTALSVRKRLSGTGSARGVRARSGSIGSIGSRHGDTSRLSRLVVEDASTRRG